MDVIALPGDAHGATAGDFAARGVRHARLDVIFVILPGVARRGEGKGRLARRVGFEGGVGDDLVAAIPAAPAAVRRIAIVHVLVKPRIRARLLPEITEGFLLTTTRAIR